MARDIQTLGSLRSQETCALSCYQNSWQDVAQLPGEAIGLDKLIEFLHHFSIIVLGDGINRYHAGSITNSQYELSCHLPMHITCQGGQELDVPYMLLVVEDTLIEMRNTPTQGDIIVEEFRELGSCLSRIGISPGTERNKYLVLFVESHIAMHHGREANSCQRLNLTVVLLEDILAQIGIAILKTIPDGLHRVCPKSVDELVLPLMRTLSYWFVILINEDSLNTCGTEFNSQDGLSGLDCLFSVHI